MALKFALTVITILGISPALSADLAIPAEPIVLAPAPTPWSFGIEGSPEFYAIDEDPHDNVPGSESKKPANSLADYYGKVSLSYTFQGTWVIGGSFQAQVKKNRDTSGSYTDDTYAYNTEGTLGYKFRWNAFSLTPSVGIGYYWGATGIYGDVSTSKDNNAAYYALTLAGDWKLNPQWTWNVFNLRYRNAFNYTWVTPKVATGVTYNITSVDAVYANVGYSWKELNASGQATSPPFNPNYGSLDSDKWNVAVGYKRAF